MVKGVIRFTRFIMTAIIDMSGHDTNVKHYVTNKYLPFPYTYVITLIHKLTAPSKEIDPISKKHAILRQIRGPETAIIVSPKEERRHDADIQARGGYSHKLPIWVCAAPNPPLFTLTRSQTPHYLP